MDVATVAPVNLGDRSYEIRVGASLLPRLGELLAPKISPRATLVVTDDLVGPIYGDVVLESLISAGYQASIVSLPPGEATKTLESAAILYDELVARNADRGTLIIALGGGVIGDLAGFVAATYARGVPFVQAPTSLLAMVDASVGGKVAVDHPLAKNMIGAFHQPVAVICDLWCLDSLPERQYKAGLAEIVKHGVALSESLFAYIDRHSDAVISKESAVVRHLVAESCKLKASVVEKDEFDTLGLRAALNFGHTFAHAFETAGEYASLLHGEAVAIGMICAGFLAEELGMVDAAFNERLQLLWDKLRLPSRMPPEYLESDLIGLMRHDKKANAGQLRFVLPLRIGAVEIVDGIDEALVARVLERAASD